MKTSCLVLGLLLAAASSALAQRHKLTAINAETPEGKLLQSILQEAEESKKTDMMQQFVAQHGGHGGVGWVYSQLQAAHLKAGAAAKAIEVGEKLLTIDKDDLDAAYGNLKASEAMKDAAGVMKWSAMTSELAKKQAQSQQPSDAEAVEQWKHSVDYAKQVDTYTEYALYAQVLQNSDPATIMKLVEALDQRAPQSQYMAQVLGRYAMAARQSNQLDKAVALGEKASTRNQAHEDMLLAMADFYMQKNQQPDKVVAYGNKVAELMSTQAKPEGYSDADWDKKKNTSMGLGHWMAGITLAGQSKFAAADKSLRAALPLIEGNEQLTGPALFYLGLANYRMGQASKNKAQIADAARFSRQASAIKGPFQGRAAQNLKSITMEFGLK